MSKMKRGFSGICGNVIRKIIVTCVRKHSLKSDRELNPLKVFEKPKSWQMEGDFPIALGQFNWFLKLIEHLKTVYPITLNCRC